MSTFHYSVDVPSYCRLKPTMKFKDSLFDLENFLFLKYSIIFFSYALSARMQFTELWNELVQRTEVLQNKL